MMTARQRRRLIRWASFAVCLLTSGPLVVRGQTVQLPTYRVFQMPLNVVVPDGGTAFAGGTKSSIASRSTRGLPLLGPVSQSRFSSTGSNSVSVSATIIDHREWDAAVLAEAARRSRGRPQSPEQIAAQRMTEQIRSQPSGQSLQQIAARARQSQQTQRTREEAEAIKLIRHGNECLAKGQYGAARIFFRTAIRQSSGTTRQLAERGLAAVSRR